MPLAARSFALEKAARLLRIKPAHPLCEVAGKIQKNYGEHATHAVAPAAQVVPAEQSKQTLAPLEAEYFPAGQSVHTVAPHNEYFPAAQLDQMLTPVVEGE